MNKNNFIYKFFNYIGEIIFVIILIIVFVIIPFEIKKLRYTYAIRTTYNTINNKHENVATNLN